MLMSDSLQMFLYGSKSLHLSVSDDDPFATEIYRTELDRNANSEDETAPPSQFITRANKQRLIPISPAKRVGSKAANAAAQAVDPAIAALKAGMSEELSKKPSRYIAYICFELGKRANVTREIAQ